MSNSYAGMARFYADIMQAIAEEDLQKIADITYRELNYPVIIIDLYYRVLAVTPREKIGDVYWDAQIDHGYTPNHLILSGYKNNFRQKALSGDDVTIIDWGVDNPRVVGNIRINGAIHGFFNICYTNESRPVEEVMSMVRILNKACSAAMKNDMRYGITQSSIRYTFASLLFAGREFSADEIKEWQKKVGIVIRPGFAVLAMPIIHEDRFSIEYLVTFLKQIDPSIMSYSKEGRRYYLITGLRNQAVYEDVCQRLRQILKDIDLHAGISQQFFNIADVPQYAERAWNCCCLAGSLPDSSSLGIYDQMLDSIILSPTVNQLNRDDYMHSCLLQLQQYDQQHNTPYFKSLQVYINCMCDNHLAAEELCVHRNTLLYRLKKSSEICGCDLLEPKLCRQLMISMWALELLEKQHAAEEAAPMPAREHS